MSWRHAAATVPGDVPGERGQRGDVPDGHEEHVQPQAGGAQEVRPEGEQQPPADGLTFSRVPHQRMSEK